MAPGFLLKLLGMVENIRWSPRAG